MAIPILKNWQNYFSEEPNEGLGSSYERIILNNKLREIIKKYKCETLLEVPIFGFTGITGINSITVAKSGISATLIDNDKQRLEMVRSVWKNCGLKANFYFQENFQKLNFEDNCFDISWNFSALWLVNSLEIFFKELTRVTKKVIWICVPNRFGFGYISQKYISGNELKKELKEDNIVPKNIIKEMKNLNWKLVERNYIDCPPWPDIGMNKREFLKIFHLDFLLKLKREKNEEKLCILDYYTNKDSDFSNRMMKYYWFEKIAPNFIKFFCAHHKYMIFTKT